MLSLLSCFVSVSLNKIKNKIGFCLLVASTGFCGLLVTFLYFKPEAEKTLVARWHCHPESSQFLWDNFCSDAFKFNPKGCKLRDADLYQNPCFFYKIYK